MSKFLTGLPGRALLVVSLLFPVFCSGDAPVQDGYVDINGTALYYKTTGEGDPIVVLHGGPGFDHRQFLPYIWDLAEDHQVILYDQRGTGLSSGQVDPVSISIGTFIQDIEEIRKAFGLEKMNLLGHSWGGILAMHYAVKHPESLKSLILCSTAASVDSFATMRATYTANRLPEDQKLLEEMMASDALRNGDPKAYEEFWRVYFKPYFDDQSLVAGLDLQFAPNTIKYGSQVAGYMLDSIGAFDLHDELKTLHVPTLIVHGESDPMSPDYARRIHESIAGSQLVLIEHTGHWLFIDGRETFRDSILSFLKDLGEMGPE